MLTYVIIGVVFLYVSYVIYRKVSDIKKGKLCDCSGCSKLNCKQRL